MLRSQPGIHSVKVALLAERGVVEFDPNQWTTEKVINVSSYHATQLSSSFYMTYRKYLTLVSTLRSSLPVVRTKSPCVSME